MTFKQITSDAITSLEAKDLESVVELDAIDHPTSIFVGRGSLALLASRTRGTVLVVGSRGSLQRTGFHDFVQSQSNWHIFEGVVPNPTPEVIGTAAILAKEVAAETIVGIGGGSSLDAARCVALMHGDVTCVGGLRKALQNNSSYKRQRRLVQVPTTAGTGSEVTPFAAIWSEDGNKSSVEHQTAFADMALVDPQLSDSMGPRLTASVGLDAMAHAMEAIWGRYTDPVACRYAERALHLVNHHLLECLEAPSQVHRNGVSLAALLAGLALARSRSAIAHALSYGLTGHYGIEHGIAVGMLCRALLPFQMQDAPEQVERILGAFATTQYEPVVDFINQVLRAASLEPTLSSFGVPSDVLPQIAQQAICSNRLSNSLGCWNSQRLIEVLEALG